MCIHLNLMIFTKIIRGFISAELGFYETLSLTANFIIIIILCWGGYRVFTPRRNNVSHGDTRLISQRIFWQIVFPATLFLILFQFAAFVGLLASRENLVGVMPFNLGTLVMLPTY